MHFITLYNPGFVKRGRSLMVSLLIAYWWVSSPSHARDKQRGQTAAESARVVRQVWTRRQTRSFILDSISLVLREFGLISGLLTAKRKKSSERKGRWMKGERNTLRVIPRSLWSVYSVSTVICAEIASKLRFASRQHETVLRWVTLAGFGGTKTARRRLSSPQSRVFSGSLSFHTARIQS